jgi:hypothetical protein
LTADQFARVTEIVDKFKPALARIELINASFVAPVRADIKYNGSGSVTITCAAVAGATSFTTFFRPQTGVVEWNGGPQALTGTGPASVTYTPGSTFYWVACADATIPGLLTNEVTNALTTPVLTATAQTRNVHLSWPAVSGATSYRLYRSIASHGQPSAMDNASTPIRVDAVTYDDPLESGTTRFYIVVPMVGDAESFYSNEVSGTSL